MYSYTLQYRMNKLYWQKNRTKIICLGLLNGTTLFCPKLHATLLPRRQLAPAESSEQCVRSIFREWNTCSPKYYIVGGVW